LIEIWRDDAPGERRAALVEDGKIVELHVQRDLQMVFGECGAGRIDRKAPSGSYIAIDGGVQLLVRGKSPAAEGERVAFEIMREAIAEPGRIKPAEAWLVDAAPNAPADKDAMWNGRLKRLQADATIFRPLADAFDCAVAGASHIGDVTVSFQRTKAGLVFDIDGIGDPLSINLAAAKEVARLLRLYQVGGMVMIDFVSVESREQRKAVAGAFDQQAALDLRPFERSAINGYGLMQVVRARPRPSILDHLFGTRIASLCDETQAYWLLREVAQSSGFGKRVLTARTNVATLLNSPKWQPFRAACERLTGAPLEIVADQNLTGYGHVHVAQS
jgi:ribonuclease G